MKKKPEGESRTPTDLWSGLGFSKSMPDQAIRERLKQMNIKLANKNSLCSTQVVSGPASITFNYQNHTNFVVQSMLVLK